MIAKELFPGGHGNEFERLVIQVDDCQPVPGKQNPEDVKHLGLGQRRLIVESDGNGDGQRFVLNPFAGGQRLINLQSLRQGLLRRRL